MKIKKQPQCNEAPEAPERIAGGSEVARRMRWWHGHSDSKQGARHTDHSLHLRSPCGYWLKVLVTVPAQ